MWIGLAIANESIADHLELELGQSDDFIGRFAKLPPFG
jgi:hypothetical protein